MRTLSSLTGAPHLPFDETPEDAENHASEKKTGQLQIIRYPLLFLQVPFPTLRNRSQNLILSPCFKGIDAVDAQVVEFLGIPRSQHGIVA